MLRFKRFGVDVPNVFRGQDIEFIVHDFRLEVSGL